MGHSHFLSVTHEQKRTHESRFSVDLLHDIHRVKVEVQDEAHVVNVARGPNMAKGKDEARSTADAEDEEKARHLIVT
jgi:hypothetical protein